MIRPCPEPSASRSTISFRRAAVRASIRLATFAQAINSTTPTIDISTASGVEKRRRRSDSPRAPGSSSSRLATKRWAKVLDDVLISLTSCSLMRR